jgi:uncharacterized tellurite resistance protein B-like protein
MALPDRLVPLCDLLLGAAHADKQFEDREREEIYGMLADLVEGKLPSEVEERITKFDPRTFDLAATAAVFRDDPVDDRRRLLFLVAAINEADDELDLAEDDYLRAVAKALDLGADALQGLTIDVEIEELRSDFAKVRRAPPPPPGKRISDAFDVDID